MVNESDCRAAHKRSVVGSQSATASSTPFGEAMNPGDARLLPSAQIVNANPVPSTLGMGVAPGDRNRRQPPAPLGRDVEVSA
jgi:hypothetical protein